MDRNPACILCRGVKVKCVNDNDLSQPCQRCRRLDVPCAYSKKRRRLKAGERAAESLIPATIHPSSSLTSDRERAGPTSSLPVSAIAAADTPGHLSHPHSHGQSPLGGVGPSVTESHLRRTLPRASAIPDDADSAKGTWHELEIATGVEASLSVSTGRQRRNLLDDPIVVGYLTEHEGARMAELYHQYLNPGIALLDPYLHSFTYLREHSALLLSAVLAVTAKFFHKELYPRLGSHSQRLISRAVEQGTCTTAIVQAILIMVYWKEPRDTSAWIKIGLAIRMGYQLGFHTGNIPDTPLDDELALREKLDRERTWFALVAFDKTYAGTFNLPNAIKDSEYGDMEQWINDHGHLDIDNDLRLCCSLETLVLFDGVRAWRAECRALSPRQALLQVEGLFDRTQQLYAKWCNRGPGLPRGLGERQKGIITFVLRHVLFQLRFGMLNFVPPEQVEMVLSECVDRAAAYIEILRIVTRNGTWSFQQDIASVKTAASVVSMQSLYYRVSSEQRPIVLGIIQEMHQLCVNVADNQANSPSAFVGRFLEKVLSNIEAGILLAQAEAEAAAEQARVQAQAAETQTEASMTTLLATKRSRSLTPEVPVAASESSGPVDHLVFGDLTEFLGMTGMSLGDTGSTDEQYWSSLMATLPLSINDFV